jgi:hypothetical protein
MSLGSISAHKNNALCPSNSLETSYNNLVHQIPFSSTQNRLNHKKITMPLVTKTSNDGRKPLTFGIEIELALAGLSNGQSDPQLEARRYVYNIDLLPSTVIPAHYPSWNVEDQVNWRVGRHIVETVKKASIPAMTLAEFQDDKNDQLRNPENTDQIYRQLWIITDDITIEPPTDEEPIKDNSDYI